MKTWIDSVSGWIWTWLFGESSELELSSMVRATLADEIGKENGGDGK